MKSSKSLLKAFFDNGYFLSLATQDDGGLWVSDVFYVADDEWNIYWLSADETRHSKAIANNPHVAGTITITTTSQEPSEALQIVGNAERVEGSGEMIEKLFLQKRGKEKKTEASRYEGRQSWYKITPTKIRLSHQDTFGLEKQDVQIKEEVRTSSTWRSKSQRVLMYKEVYKILFFTMHDQLYLT